MQIFLPYQSTPLSVKCLDKKRCFKQTVEAFQILNTITGKSEGWRNHPAVKMVYGYEGWLIHYYNTALVWSYIYHEIKIKKLKLIKYDKPITVPPWIGDERLHSSHRSNLLRKDEVFYGKYGWREPNNLPYFWPTNNS